MKILRSLDELAPSAQGGAVSIGNFDGVHLGHARLAGQVVTAARQRHRPAVIFTFDPHPAQLLRPNLAPARLTWLERKSQLLERLGIDYLIVYPTSLALLEWPPQTFFEIIVQQALRASVLVEGPNFCFGKDRQGDIHLLKRLCQEANVELVVCPPVEVDGQMVSSSRVRRLLGCGDVAAANRLLTEPYRIRGQVVPGAGRGQAIGVPTANLSGVDTLLPAAGVYAGRVYWRDNRWPAAIHIGPNPTFGEGHSKVEVHLIGFQGELYGQWLEVDFCQRLRDTQTFASVSDLQAQLQRDIQQAASLLENQVYAS
ncbi:MAG: riboflavin biosynthesis protein [Pirellulaceae bacterium]|nr:MAG: riboflavin biosynthesis protein [Pirellulaceae bacterium]GIW93286.1 MAG: riboflavin biosynthesis protein [Pirellulaceae bacterium]